MRIPLDASGRLMTPELVINSLANYFGGTDEAKSAVKRAFDSGKANIRELRNLNRGATNDYAIQEVQNAIDNLMPFWKDPGAAIQAELKDIRSKDYASLNDGELADVQKRLNVINDIGQMPAYQQAVGTSTKVGPDGIAPNSDSPLMRQQALADRKTNFVYQIARYLGSPGANDLADRIQKGEINTPEEYKNFLAAHQIVSANSSSNGGGHNDDTFQNLLRFATPETIRTLQGKDYSGSGAGYGGGDYSGDLKAIGDIISLRGRQTEAQSQADSLVSSLPQELARGRNEFYNAAVGQGQQYFNESLAPSIMQSLNARGILNSGDLESELSRGAGDIQGSIQSSIMNQQAADDAFFMNAAYQQTFQKEIQAGQDLSSQVQNSRGQAMQNQQFGFQRIQGDLSRQYQDMIMNREQQRQMTLMRQNFDQQQRLANKQNQANEYGQIGQTVGSIGGAVLGAYFGGPPGAVVGSGIGGQAGAQFGQSKVPGVTSR